MLSKRSQKLERMDIGDYTPEEYERFLKDIAYINRNLGDNAAIEKTLLAEIERLDLKEFSVLDLGAGSGEMLRFIAEFAKRTGRRAHLVGLDLHSQSLQRMLRESAAFKVIDPLLADALQLPFGDNAFDFTISSLFTHHLKDDQVVAVFREMDRVSRRGIFSIDLHRHPMAWILYRLFCWSHRISPMVRQDGSLSILRSFKPDELLDLGRRASLENLNVESHAPYRLVLRM
ncbi:MAG: methyltransferase domain-containing protein [Acidobacteriota bacterium]